MHSNTYSTYAYSMGKRKSGETVHPGRDCQSCARCGTTAVIQKIEIKSTHSLACVTNVNNNHSVLIIIKYHHHTTINSFTRGIMSMYYKDMQMRSIF